MKNIIIRKYIEFAVKENQSIADLLDFLSGTSVDALAEYCVENNILPHCCPVNQLMISACYSQKNVKSVNSAKVLCTIISLYRKRVNRIRCL